MLRLTVAATAIATAALAAVIYRLRRQSAVWSSPPYYDLKPAGHIMPLQLPACEGCRWPIWQGQMRRTVAGKPYHATCAVEAGV